jgi:hypothetical protein
MTSDLPGAMPRVGPIPGTLIRLAVLVLPAEHRTRYDDEFRAELVDVPLPRRSAHALSLLLGAVPLRRALADVGPTTVRAPARAWRCRLGRHRWTMIGDDNPENRRSMHLSCLRCGRNKDIDEYGPPRPTSIASF